MFLGEGSDGEGGDHCKARVNLAWKWLNPQELLPVKHKGEILG